MHLYVLTNRVTRTGKEFPNRKKYTPEQKAAHSERMKMWWAERRWL